MAETNYESIVDSCDDNNTINQSNSPKAEKVMSEGVATSILEENAKISERSLDGVKVVKDDNDIEDVSKARRDLEIESFETSNQLFVIDPFPCSKQDIKIPLYHISNNTSLKNASTDDAKCTRILCCFNCEGDHNCRDCPEPRDHGRINRNRIKKNQPAVRYHADDDQRFGNFRPGQISKNLRDALGLDSRQYPMHVHHMRIMGYPPGWLEEHRVTRSGLNLFDSQGNAVQHSDDEEGVTDDSKIKYDTTKIISYPGYNEALAPGMVDDCYKFRTPAYDPMQDKRYMIERMAESAVDPCRKRKLKLVLPSTPAVLNNQIEDMDIGDDESPTETIENGDNFNALCFSSAPVIGSTGLAYREVDTYQSGGSISSSDSSKSDNDNLTYLSDNRANSPSLADLEMKKMLLLAELNETDITPLNNAIEIIEIVNKAKSVCAEEEVKLSDNVIEGLSPGKPIKMANNAIVNSSPAKVAEMTNNVIESMTPKEPVEVTHNDSISTEKDIDITNIVIDSMCTEKVIDMTNNVIEIVTPKEPVEVTHNIIESISIEEEFGTTNNIIESMSPDKQHVETTNNETESMSPKEFIEFTHNIIESISAKKEGKMTNNFVESMTPEKTAEFTTEIPRDTSETFSLNSVSFNEEEPCISEKITLVQKTPIRGIKSSTLGTPVLRYSPYSNLPSAEKFSKQISEVINFENLPGAVGKYNNMRGVLVKVRNTLQDLNQ